MHKFCIKCETTHLLDNFYKIKTNKDGYSFYCKFCTRANQKEYANKNKETILAKRKEEYYNNKKQILAKNNKYYQKNKARINKVKLKWGRANRHIGNACRTRRNALKVKASPCWLSKEQNRLILDFYAKAKELTLSTGIKHEVDHIIPLKNNLVCGLNVPWNLQILTKSDNIQKSNKLLEEYINGN